MFSILLSLGFKDVLIKKWGCSIFQNHLIKGQINYNVAMQIRLFNGKMRITMIRVRMQEKNYYSKFTQITYHQNNKDWGGKVLYQQDITKGLK